MMRLKSISSLYQQFGVSTHQNAQNRLLHHKPLHMFNNCKFFSIGLRRANQNTTLNSQTAAYKTTITNSSSRSFRTSASLCKKSANDLYGKLLSKDKKMSKKISKECLVFFFLFHGSLNLLIFFSVETLGITPAASEKEIKRAFLMKAK